MCRAKIDEVVALMNEQVMEVMKIPQGRCA